MVGFDFSPFYRTTVGFDRMARALESAAGLRNIDDGFPPYDIEAVGEDHYRLTFAIAGFTEDDLDIEVKENTLFVSGERKNTDADTQYLHHGIAGRSFKRQFRLADYVQVENAWLKNGLLTIDLVREVPEEKKPRTIQISSGSPTELKSKAKNLIGGKEKAA
ncbi:MAG: Hsp20 family protein [Alphaproteobacteria bacterium]|nr:Hsp20 family protein [Alphaproteobacteria bacterium]